MPRFFTDTVEPDLLTLTGEDAAHSTRVLRMQAGEELTVCDARGTDARCVIDAPPAASAVRLRVLERMPTVSEPRVRVTLFQALPKADKMEWIIQKAVELGVHGIVPVLTLRCVSRPDDKALRGKLERWNRIAREAAMQSGRGMVPRVAAPLPFARALEALAALPVGLLLYERAGGVLSQALAGAPSLPDALGLLVGPEGGFDESEAAAAEGAGLRLAGLGPRILRTETAPLAALAAVLYAAGEL